MKSMAPIRTSVICIVLAGILLVLGFVGRSCFVQRGNDPAVGPSVGGQEIRQQRTLEAAGRPIAFTVGAGGPVLATGFEGVPLKIWDARSGTDVCSIEEKPAPRFGFWQVVLSPNGKWLASGGTLPDPHDGYLNLWEFTGKKKALSFSEKWSINCPRFSPDSTRIAYVCLLNTIRVRDLSGKEVWSFEAHEVCTRAIDFSPDGKHLASLGDDNTIRVWNLAARKLVRELSSEAGSIDAMAYSPDGTTLASAGSVRLDNPVVVWNVRTGRRLATLSGHTGNIRTLAFHPTGRWLASASDDGTVKVWDIRESRLFACLPHQGPVDQVTFSRDGTLMATTDDLGAHCVRVWDVRCLNE